MLRCVFATILCGLMEHAMFCNISIDVQTCMSCVMQQLSNFSGVYLLLFAH